MANFKKKLMCVLFCFVFGCFFVLFFSFRTFPKIIVKNILINLNSNIKYSNQFEANKDCGKSSRVIHSWREICYQIFAGWEVKLVRNLQKIETYIQKRKFFTNRLNTMFAWIKNTVDRVEIHWLCGKKKCSGAIINKGYDNSVWILERTHQNWFPRKKCQVYCQKTH